MGIPGPIDDASADAILSGREVDEELEPLRQLVLACRDAARTPVPPRADLAVRMTTGAFFPAARRPRRRAGSTSRPGRPPRTTRSWTRVRMAMTTGLATAAAKVARLSGAAKAAAGIAVATASITTAGAAGSLPDPAQGRFDSVVDTVTGDESPAPGRPSENAEFGERVSEDAKDGGVDGGELSEEAKQRGNRPEGVPTPARAGRPTVPPTPAELPTPPAELPTAIPTDPGGAAPAAPPGR